MNFATTAVTAASAVTVTMRAEEWSSTATTCNEEFAPRAHWYYAIFCPVCTAAIAKSNMDQSSPVYNVFCVPPCVTYSYLRLGYNLKGSWQTDCINGFLCAPCGARQAYTESKKKGHIAGHYGLQDQQWSSELFRCDDLQEVVKALFCPCIVAHDIRTMIQPTAHPAFDYPCLFPVAMYGIIRNMFGITSEWPHPALEDAGVGCFLYPCALNRALREAAYQKTVNATNAVAGVIGSAQARVQQLGTKALRSVGQLGKSSAPPAPGMS
ncbi:Hypothetical protein, putative [Bodo saltans]|uniref:Uncharacterized protein n=1 Tax=Bodo saltans TaxID=75058 RepID=A0A0S4JQQ2_BODSA|nr:Hypothetical protein, putative [Bodo saltans]|eukprot:CUG92520.1 Hypothetical protein, putative [Bodo saltans]